jgi:heme-degrading monooxygenase HmoA
VIVILFRSKLTAAAGEDYAQWSAEMDSLIRENPGFVAVKSFRADDGERLTVVWFSDADSLRAWATHPRHLEAQRLGRTKWYEYYNMDVADITRTSEFTRA